MCQRSGGVCGSAFVLSGWLQQTDNRQADAEVVEAAALNASIGWKRSEHMELNVGFDKCETILGLGKGETTAALWN